MSDYKVVNATQLDADLSSVADAIRTKGGTSESLEFPQGFIDAVGDIPSGGTEEIEQIIDQSGVLESTDGTVTEKVELLVDFAEWRKFIQERIYFFAERNQRITLFDYMQLESEKINCFDYSRISNFGDTFRNNDVITELNIDTSNATGINYMISNCGNLEKVVLTTTKNVTNYNNAFANNPKLKHIETLDFSGATNINGPFNNSNAIETIKIVPETIKKSITIPSPVLSDESIQSIIDGLAYVESTQNLTLNNQIVLTNNQKATIHAKGWTLIQ